MTIEIKRGQTAQQVADTKKANILAMLETLSTYMTNYEADGATWPGVGSQGYAEEQLTHIMVHFNLEKE